MKREDLIAINGGIVNILGDDLQVQKRIKDFLNILSQSPPIEKVVLTPDKRANTMPISHIESLLDETFLAWGTENFRTEKIVNEIVGIIDLWVIHPVLNIKIMRQGAAAIQITVDKTPENITESKERNAWALSTDNKKPNALYLSFPKLKSECIKNAAISLGVSFGRNLNRKDFSIPESFFTDKFNQIDRKELIKNIYNMLEGLHTTVEVDDFFNSDDSFCNDFEIKKLFENRGKLINLIELFGERVDVIDSKMQKRFNEIIENKEINSYDKAINHLLSITIPKSENKEKIL